MLALTVNELVAITSAVLGGILVLLILLLRDTMNLRERVARLEESVRSLLNTSRKED